MFSDILNFALGAANLAYTAHANNQQRQDQLMMYNNTMPARQMELRRAAGLNPYGDIGQVGANVPTPVNTAAGVSEGFAQMQDSLNNARQFKLDKLQYVLNTERLKNDITKTEIEKQRLQKDLDFIQEQTENLRANTAFVKSRTTYQDLENYVYNLTKDNRVSMSNYEIQQMQENIRNLVTNNEFLPLILAASLAKSDAEVKQIFSNIELNKAQINQIEEAVKAMKFDNAAIEALDEIVPDDGKIGSKLIRGAVRIAKWWKADRK